MARYRYGEGHKYRNCVICQRPFQVWDCYIRRGTGYYCTRECCYRARRLFTLAMRDEEIRALVLKKALSEQAAL